MKTTGVLVAWFVVAVVALPSTLAEVVHVPYGVAARLSIVNNLAARIPVSAGIPPGLGRRPIVFRPA